MSEIKIPGIAINPEVEAGTVVYGVTPGGLDVTHTMAQIADAAFLRNGVVTIGTSVLDEEDRTYTFEDWQWRINGVLKTPVDFTTEEIPEEEAGESRAYIVVGKEDSTFEVIAGEATTDLPIDPATPAGTIYLTRFVSSGAVIGEPEEPIIGSDDYKKIYLAEQRITEEVLEVTLPTDGRTNFIFMVGGFEMEGFVIPSGHEHLFAGKLFFLYNASDYPITLLHQFGSAPILFTFADEIDYILAPKAKAQFQYSPVYGLQLVSGGEKVDNPRRKPCLVLLSGGQSNSGTDPNTGRTPYADMPDYLRNPPEPNNIKDVIFSGGSFSTVDFVADPDNQWGYLNQVLYVMSHEYDKVILGKRGTGGTTILPYQKGTYPRQDFKSLAIASIDIATAEYGVDNFDVIMIWTLGTTNGNNEPDALVYEQALKEWFLECRSQIIDMKIIMSKIGTLQQQGQPFIVPIIQPAQEKVKLFDTERNFLMTGESDSRWQNQDLSGDVMHFNRDGAITCGNNFNEVIFQALQREKINNTPPELVSIVVNAGGATVTLTYDSLLNEAVVPFCRDFTHSTGRKINDVAVSGSTVVLTMSEPIYVGSGGTFSYYRCASYENSVQNLFGNKAEGFFLRAVDTNSSGVTVPTYSNRWTSDFSAGVDGCVVSGGGAIGVCDVVDGIGGLNDVLRTTAIGDTSPQTYRNSTFLTTIGYKYRVRVKVFIPRATLATGASTPFFNITVGPIAQFIANANFQLRGYLSVDRWVDLEYVFTATTTTSSLYFQPTFEVNDGVYYMRDIVVDRII